tara:strand:+ start:41 stop:604 length:564 start_codon:yes stop_codon:yes gene_type:complete
MIKIFQNPVHYSTLRELHEAHLNGDVSLEYDCIEEVLTASHTVTLTYPTHSIEIDLDELLGAEEWAFLTTPLSASQISAHGAYLTIQSVDIDATDAIYGHPKAIASQAPTDISLKVEQIWEPTRRSDERCIAQFLVRHGYDEDTLWATVPENCHQCGAYFAPNTPEYEDLQDHDYTCSDCREEDDDD